MNDYLNKRLKEVVDYVKNDLENNNISIDLVLYNPINEATKIIASTGNQDILIEFLAFDKDTELEMQYVPEWDFNFDYYIFDELEAGYDIKLISNDLHYGIWNSIYELYPTDIDAVDGVKKYVNYCRKNNINKAYLEKEIGTKINDIMPIFNEHKNSRDER